MTTPKDKFKPWESPSPELPESEEKGRPFICGTPALHERMQSEIHLHELRPRPATDWLGVLGVGSAALAFLLWAVPACLVGALGCLTDPEFFSFHRLPAVVGFYALAIILLLLRRR